MAFVVQMVSRLTQWRHLLTLPKRSSNANFRVTEATTRTFASKPSAPGEPRPRKPIPAKPILDKSPVDPNESVYRPIKYWDRMNVAYLSCPYFDPDILVKKSRHIIVNRVAFELISQGTMVYSPLTHNL